MLCAKKVSLKVKENFYKTIGGEARNNGWF